MRVEEYAQRYCGDGATDTPAWAREFLARMRLNCDLMMAWLARRGDA